MLDAAYYNQPVCCGEAIRHSGDNRDGINNSEVSFDESIKIDLNTISDSRTEILLFIVNAFKGGSLQDVTNASASFLTGNEKKEIAKNEVTFQKKPFQGVILPGKSIVVLFSSTFQRFI